MDNEHVIDAYRNRLMLWNRRMIKGDLSITFCTSHINVITMIIDRERFYQEKFR